MLCRHTVPDWHRYVDPGAETVPIYAACRLLVKEGEAARDPRSISCAYWGRQRECPLYEGPGGRSASRGDERERRTAADVPVATDKVWPVRPPGARDGWRRLQAGLEAVSILLLLGAAAGAVGVLRGKPPGAGYAVFALAAAGVSIVTLVLGRLLTWARR
jgi:hypothetical protein